jgi:autotransporter-associated beta strand protein
MACRALSVAPVGLFEFKLAWSNGMFRVLFIIVCLAFPLAVNAANISSTAAGGNWSLGASWAGGVVPGTADNVTIVNGSTVTVDINTNCTLLAFGTTANCALNINSGKVLNVSGAVTMARPNTGITSTIGVGSGTLNAGSVALGGTTATRVTQITVNNGVVSVSGNITSAGVGSRITFTGQGTLNAGGSFLSGTAGTFTPATGTVKYNAAGAQTVGNYAYYNVTLSGGGAKSITTASVTVTNVLSMEGAATASAAPTYGANATLQYNTTTPRAAGTEWITPFAATGGVIITNSGAITQNVAKVFNASVPLAIRSGATLATGNFQLTMGGDFNNSGTFAGGSSPVVITNTAAQSIGGFTTSGDVSMKKTAGTATFMGNVTGGSLTINGTGGTLNLGTGLTNTFSGAWTRTAGTLNGGSSLLRVGGSFSGTGGAFTAGTGTVEWNALGIQNVAAVSYNNLILSGSGAKAVATGTAVGSNLSMTGTASANLAAGITVGVNTLTLGGTNKVFGTWGSTSSAATHKNNTYFSATTGILNVTNGGLASAISNVTGSRTVAYGTASLTCTGVVSAAGPSYPANGETVSVTINGVTSNAFVAGGAGGFSVSFPTASIPASGIPYTISYAYGGNEDLNAAPTNSATTLTVNKQTPVVTNWGMASGITYGQAFSNSVLSGVAATNAAGASVAGTNSFNSPGTLPAAGTTNGAVTFTPTDAANYNTVGGTVSVTVSKQAPVITNWGTASDITYGQELSASTLSGVAATNAAGAPVPGVLSFSSPSTQPAVGTTNVAVTFTPTDSANYSTVAGTMSVTVVKQIPVVTAWGSASGITYGQALSASILSGVAATNAAGASVPGTNTFNSPGIQPGAGMTNVAVTFTPADLANYSTIAGTVTVVVAKQAPVVTNWGTASGITYGQAYSNSVLSGATATNAAGAMVPGALAFDAPDTIPNEGVVNAAVTFTPDDTVNYSAVAGTVALTVAAPLTGWFSPGGASAPGGQWANGANAIDGNTATYASHTSPGAGLWGAPLWLTNSTSFKCGRVRVYSDWSTSYVDMIRLEVRLHPSGTWTNVYEGSVQNCSWSEITFASTNIDAARYSYHYVAGAIVFWLYEFQFYADSEQVNLPTSETRDATSVEEASAILHGVVIDDGGEPCQYRFQYGLTTSYSTSSEWTGQLSDNDEFTALITGLAPFSTYHFRVQIKNSAGISSGADMTFTTGLPPTGWVSPTGYTTTGGWTNITYAYDDNLASFATCYHEINTPVWSPDLYLTHSTMTCERVRFNARDTAEIDMAVVDVHLNGAWTTVYSNNTFANQEWVEASFPRGTVTQARVKFSLTGTGFGLDWQLYEFNFYRVVDVVLSGTYDGARRVSLAVDGEYRGSFTNFTTNVYTFVETMGAGSRILVYYDDDDIATNSGALVSRVSGDDLTDLDLLDNSLILRNDFGASLTAADLAAAYTSDADVPYSVTGGNISIASNIAVRIASGSVFDAGTNSLTFRSDLINDGSVVFNGGTALFAGSTTVRGVSTSAFANVLISGALTAHSNLMTVAGNWVQNGVFNHNNGAVTFDGNTVMSGTATSSFNHVAIEGAVTAPAILNVAGTFLNNGTFSNNNGTVVFNGTSLIGGSSATTFSNVTIAASCSLAAPAGLLYVNGNWSNGGVFTHSSGTVVFATPSQATITGGNTFNNFTCTTPGKQINFGAGETQAVLGVFTVSGANGNNIKLRSSSGVSKWSIRFPNGSQTVGYVDVRDSDALDNSVTVGGGNDSGNNNANWIFASSRYWVGGSGNWSDTNHWALISGGAPGAAVPDPGNIVFFDGNSGAGATCLVDQAVAVLELNLEPLNTVTVSQGGNAIMIQGGGFHQAAGNFKGGIGNFETTGGFLLSGGTFIAPSSSLTLRSGFAHSGGVFSNNSGTVIFAGNSLMEDSVSDPFANIVISNSVTAPSGSLRVTGNWADNGSFIHNNGTVVFEGTSVMGGVSTSRFRNITISGSLTAGASAISVEGNWVNQGIFDPNGGIAIFAGSTEITGSSTSMFNRVTITGGLSGHSSKPVRISGAWVNSGTYNPNNGVIVFSGNTEISGSSTSTFNHVVIEGALAGHAGQPFSVAGNWTQDGTYNDNNGTVVFNGNSQLGGSRTSQFNNVEMWGVMTAPATNLMVSGNWINHGTFSHNNGTVVFNGTTLMSGANVSSFSNMTVAGTVRLHSAERIGDASAVTVQGVLDLDGKAETIASLAGSGQVLLGGADLAVAGNASTLFSGVISESGSVIKRGTGTLALAGANTYTGSTRVENGAIEVGITDALPVTTILRLGNSGNTGSARVNLAGFDQQLAGLITDGTNMTMLVTNTVHTFSTLGVNNDTPCSYAGLIGGSLSLVKDGSGMMILGGGTNGLTFANTYRGSTLVRSGVLAIGADCRIASSTNITVLASGSMTILNSANVLNDDAEVYLQTGSKLILTNGVNDEVWSLYFDGQIAAPGVWGAVGCQWTNTDFFAGSGTLIVSNGVAQPVVTITNTASGTRLPFRTTQYTLAGQAVNVVGALWYTNSWGGGMISGTLPASTSWTLPLSLPSKGTYMVVIYGTNSAGTATQASVIIIRNKNKLFWFAK